MIKVKIVNLSYQSNSNFLYNICRINRGEFKFHDFNFNRSGCKIETKPGAAPVRKSSLISPGKRSLGETPWNTPSGTPEGYYIVGRKLGSAIEKLLREEEQQQ
ncbi:hypothetical protein [Niastella sp. OAS944]|uniref:hypothetical protein n=1 Tax=Niastella sp. OAS944 TaxID=2664089 RepID=UPI00348D08A0|nr:hypothetical protein [Chitinophagaceae bacterium OAS944]